MKFLITRSSLQHHEVVGKHADYKNQEKGGEDPTDDDSGGEAGVGIGPVRAVDAGEDVVEGDGDGGWGVLGVGYADDAHKEARAGVAVLVTSSTDAVVGVTIDHHAAAEDLMDIRDVGGGVLIPSYPCAVVRLYVAEISHMTWHGGREVVRAAVGVVVRAHGGLVSCAHVAELMDVDLVRGGGNTGDSRSHGDAGDGCCLGQPNNP